MLDYIKKYYRNKAVRGMKEARGAEFVNLGDVSSIGFVYNINSVNAISELSEICDYFRRVNIVFKGLAVETRKGILAKLFRSEKGPDPSAPVMEELFGRELSVVEYGDLSWIGIPAPSALASFLPGRFDLFISFNQNNNFTLNYITYKVNARLIIGMTNQSDIPYSMVLEGEQKSILPPAEYLKQIFHYLNIIKSNVPEE